MKTKTIIIVFAIIGLANYANGQDYLNKLDKELTIKENEDVLLDNTSSDNTIKNNLLIQILKNMGNEESFPSRFELQQKINKNFDTLVSKNSIDTSLNQALKKEVDSLIKRINNLTQEKFEINYKNYIIIDSTINATVVQLDTNNCVLFNSKYDSLSIDQKTLNRLRVIRKKEYLDIKKKLDANYNIWKKECRDKLLYLLKDTMFVVNETKIKTYKDRGEKILAEINIQIISLVNIKKEEEAFFKEKSKDNKERATNDVDALPSLIAPLSAAYIIPGIKVLGSRSYKSKNGSGAIHALELFISNIPNVSIDSIKNEEVRFVIARNLLIPEASTFGFKYNYTQALGQERRTGFNFNAYFLNKNIPEVKNTTTVKGYKTSSFGQIKVGLQYSFIEQILSLYGNYNGIAAISNTDNYEKYFGISNNIKSFLDVGLKAILNLDKKNRLNLI